MGTCPPLLYLTPREKILGELVDMFFPKHDHGEDEVHTFGLIVGAAGTGKTALVTSFCNMYPERVLLFEVREPKTFSTDLASMVAMNIAPSNIFDFVLGHFSSDYFMYYRLSDDQTVALNKIFASCKVLQIHLNRHIEKCLPCLLIVPIPLAKHEVSI